jgi:hypothetical protein
MATGAEEPAAAGTTPAPAVAAARRQEEGQALFEEKLAELVAEARGVSRGFGVDVRAVAFRPDGRGAVQHEFLGAPLEARVTGVIRRAVARDVSAMGTKEVAEHERQLQTLRAVVARELQAKAKAAAAGAAKRAPEQQEEADGAGGSPDNKTRRISDFRSSPGRPHQAPADPQ